MKLRYHQAWFDSWLRFLWLESFTQDRFSIFFFKVLNSARGKSAKFFTESITSFNWLRCLCEIWPKCRKWIIWFFTENPNIWNFRHRLRKWLPGFFKCLNSTDLLGLRSINLRNLWWLVIADVNHLVFRSPLLIYNPLCCKVQLDLIILLNILESI